jgi:hypothetical protein
MAGHGGQQDREYKNGGENHGGFGGDMKQRSARWHYDSPHLIVRRELHEHFKEGVATFLRKDCTEGQGEIVSGNGKWRHARKRFGLAERPWPA